MWSIDDRDRSFNDESAGGRNIVLFASILFDLVWKCKISLTHGGPSLNPSILVDSILKVYTSCLVVSNGSRPNSAPPWSPLPMGWIKLNTDVALNGEFATLACVARNEDGVIIY